MPMRQQRQSRVARSGSRAPHRRRRLRARRRLWITSIALLLPLALVLAALLAASGQARAASERSPEEAALILAERQAHREERAAELKARHEAKWKTVVERNNAVVKTSCTEIVWNFRNFPDLPNNTVTLKLKINKVITWGSYSFDGPSSTYVQPINAPPGQYKIDTRGKWRHMNGVGGGFDIGMSVNCPARPAFTVQKLQRLDGSGSYTTSPLSGTVGQTVDYEMIVTNTGNVALSFGPLSDPQCDSGTIAGGPAGGKLAPETSATYTCTHLLTAANATAKSISNTVTLTGTPPEEEGEPVKQTSNTVVVEVVAKPPPSEQETPPKETPTTPGSPAGTPSSGVAASSTAQAPQSGVLALKQSVVPALKVSVPRLSGPQGCVRSSFRASVKAAGVSSVGFYLDGRKLKTMTAKSARNGQITIVINPAKLKVGAHRLMAKITMVAKAAASGKPVRATRTATVLRCRAAVLTPRFTG